MPWVRKRYPLDLLPRLAQFGDRVLPGAMSCPRPDLNADGTGDLVWPLPGPPSFLALSGKDGSLLWTDGAKGRAVPGHGRMKRSYLARIMGTPAVVDVDGDRSPDLIAEFAVFDDPRGLNAEVDLTQRRGMGNEIVFDGYRIVVAVSGRSGKQLWNYAVDRPTGHATGRL